MGTQYLRQTLSISSHLRLVPIFPSNSNLMLLTNSSSSSNNGFQVLHLLRGAAVPSWEGQSSFQIRLNQETPIRSKLIAMASQHREGVIGAKQTRTSNWIRFKSRCLKTPSAMVRVPRSWEWTSLKSRRFPTLRRSKQYRTSWNWRAWQVTIPPWWTWALLNQTKSCLQGQRKPRTRETIEEVLSWFLVYLKTTGEMKENSNRLIYKFI